MEEREGKGEERDGEKDGKWTQPVLGTNVPMNKRTWSGGARETVSGGKRRMKESEGNCKIKILRQDLLKKKRDWLLRYYLVCALH